MVFIRHFLYRFLYTLICIAACLISNHYHGISQHLYVSRGVASVIYVCSLLLLPAVIRVKVICQMCQHQLQQHRDHHHHPRTDPSCPAGSLLNGGLIHITHLLLPLSLILPLLLLLSRTHR